MKLNNIEDTYPLSPMQQGMLFHSLYAPGSGVDIEQMVIDLQEGLDVPTFEQAWGRLVARHSVLRTSFRWEGLQQPLQDVHQVVSLPLIQYDWRGLPAQAKETRLQAYLREDRQNGFDLTRPPLMRLVIFRLGEAHYRCIWTFHHILLDGRSFPIVLQEVLGSYEALRQGTDLRLEPPRPYRDYINWLQEQDIVKGEAFWRQVLQGFAAPTPLVVDRLTDQGEGHAELEIRLSTGVTSALGALAQQHQLSLNTIVQGAWAVLLSRYSGEEDVLFGATRACRRSTVVGAESMVGLFINTLPVRARVSPGIPLLSWLGELRAQQMAVREYEHIPLVKIQEWSEVPGGTPLFNSLLVFENYLLNSVLQAKGGNWRNRQFRLLEQTNYPLTLNAYAGSGLLLKIAYDRRHFDDGTIGRMLGHLETLLESMAANPDRSLSELPLLTEAERYQLLVEWNRSSQYLPQRQGHCIHQLFEAQAQRTPDAAALVFPSVGRANESEGRQEELLSYRELNRQANQLAHYLNSVGVGPDVPVGICMERSVEMVVAILGVLKAGGAYVPLDPAYPPERLAFMLEDTQSPLLLTQSGLLGKLAEPKVRVMCLDTDWREIAAKAENAKNPDSGVSPDNLAYVIYTSGSTGTPKGVLVTHQNVVRLFDSTHPWFGFDERDVWTLFHSYAFDFSVWEMWGALLYGGRLVVVPYWVSRSPHDLYNLLRRQGVTVLNQTPSAFRQLMRAEEALGTAEDLALRLVIFGGEALELNSLEPWFDRHGDQFPQLVNMYGITETTVHVTYRPLTRADLNKAQGSLIGRPITDLQVYILDQHGQPVPIGVPGEVYVGGAGLARGYLNRPELTAERFVSHPFSSQPGARLYRSGDLARYLPNGDIEYLGRIDHQVKIRGFRIELGEIEAVLSQYPGVQESVVLANKDVRGEQQLVAYLAPDKKQTPTAGQLRAFLSSKLPDYMLPAYFVLLDALPLTPNGKINRQALPPPDPVRPELERAFVAPRDTLELQLTRLWEQILGLKPVGIRDNFFELGGHSLLAVSLFAQIERVFGVNLPLATLFQTSTIEQLAAVLRQSVWSLSSRSLVALQPSGSQPPFFCIPGNMGNVFADLGDMARHLGSDQPVYGLQDGIHNPIQIEALAAKYIDEIRTVQPQGPYMLGGVCSGGLIAFEMAQQFQANGERIAILVLIEPPSPPMPGLRPYLDLVKSVLSLGLPRFGFHWRSYLQHDTTGRTTYIRLKQKVVGNMWAAACYRPQKYVGCLTLLLADDSTRAFSREPRLDWQKLATGGIRIRYVPGSHDDIARTRDAVLKEAQMQVLAKHVRVCIDDALEEDQQD